MCDTGGISAKNERKINSFMISFIIHFMMMMRCMRDVRKCLLCEYWQRQSNYDFPISPNKFFFPKIVSRKPVRHEGEISSFPFPYT